MKVPRDALLESITHFKTDTDDAYEFGVLLEIFKAIIKNAAPIPLLPPTSAVVNWKTPTASHKRSAALLSVQDTPSETMLKRPRYSEGQDEASDDEREVQWQFSPITRACPNSAIIDLSYPLHPTALASPRLNEVDEVHIDFFASVSMNVMSSKEIDIIMDSGAGRTGTSDMSLVRNVQPEGTSTTTVTGAFGHAIKPSHTGTFGPPPAAVLWLEH